MQEKPSYRHALVAGSLFVLLGEFFFVCMGMTIKVLSESIPSENLVFFRNLFALFVLIPLLMSGGFSDLKTSVPWMHVLRSLSGVLAMYCFFYAISHIQLADAMLLKLTGPLFIPLIAYLWIQESIHSKTIAAILLGFIGVTIILQPGGEMHTAALVGLIGGALAAFAKVAIRKMSITEPTTRIVFYFALFSAVFSVIPVYLNWHTPTSEQWFGLVLLALVATGGQLCLTHAYRLAPASQIGPFTYSSVVFAAIAGWLFWDETLLATTLFGGALVISAGLMLLHNRKTA